MGKALTFQSAFFKPTSRDRDEKFFKILADAIKYRQLMEQNMLVLVYKSIATLQ